MMFPRFSKKRQYEAGGEKLNDAKRTALLRPTARQVIRKRIYARVSQLLTGTSKLVRWLSPPCCLICKEVHGGQRAICLLCEMKLPQNTLSCRQCGLPLSTKIRRPSTQGPPSERCIACYRHPPHFSQTLAPFLMQTGMRELIQLWKFRGQSQLTPLLAALFELAAPFEYTQSLPESAVLVPVPTQWRRQIRRGFDHTWLLAEALRWQLPDKYEVKPWLQNTRYQTPQHQLNRRTRIQRGADRFVVHRGVAGRHIILIDDVMTTGSTVRSAAAACAKGGAESISVWCLARTPPEDKTTDALR
jgi:ComF family protein